MNKGVFLLAAAWCMAFGATAQEADSLRFSADNSDVTFTESQLDDDNDANQNVVSVAASKSDPYLSEVGYRFSPMRFKVRAYDNAYNQTYINGLPMNDLDRWGGFAYSIIGGLNDVTRNKEGVGAFDFNSFGLAPIGGAQNINMRPSQYAAGHKLVLSGTNRNYYLRGMYTYATGILPSGWSVAGSVGYRYAHEGVIEGTFYNAFSYFLGAEKMFNEHHSLSLITFGAPTERGQQGASTEEAYWLANSHYYNPYWGYQNGEKRNSRIVHDFQPTAIMTWDWKMDEGRKLSTSLGFRYGMYASTALGWSGNAYDPRPDYYKNFPSSIFNVYDGSINNPSNFEQFPYLLEEYNTLYQRWTACKANRQINWDQLYYANRQNEAAGGETLYYVENRHDDQMVFVLNSTYNHSFDQYNKLAIGATYNHTTGMHYKTMYDLLGGTRYTDIDKFAANDYGAGSKEAQNDLRNPNRQIGVDDRFGYDYNLLINKATAWTQYQYNRAPYTITLGANIDGTSIERDGKMQNGRGQYEYTVEDGTTAWHDHSYGKSGAARFLSGGGQFTIGVRPYANNLITFSGFAKTQAPLARNSFVAPRIQNNFVQNLKVEKIYGGELAYAFRAGKVLGKISAYYSKFMDGVEQSAFYNDQESRFTYLTMSGVERQHYGLEAAFVYQVTSSFSLNLMGTISDARYTGNPYAELNFEGMTAATIAELNTWQNPVTGKNMPLRVIADGMHVAGTPLTAVSLGAKYSLRGWFFEAALNYYDRVYIDFSEYRRLSNVLKNYTNTSVDAGGNLVFEGEAEARKSGGVFFDGTTGDYVKSYSAKQEKCDGGFMLDLSIGRYMRLAKGRSLSINLSVNNVTNNRNMRTGGFEQNRDDYYQNSGSGDNQARSYVFSKNSKYYYANAINAFLNISFKF